MQLLLLILPREQGFTCEQLKNDASETPHVDGTGVLNAKYDLRSTIKSRLNVGIDDVALGAARAKVYNFDATLGSLSQQDVLRFQVTVDHLVISEMHE